MKKYLLAALLFVSPLAADEIQTYKHIFPGKSTIKTFSFKKPFVLLSETDGKTTQVLLKKLPRRTQVDILQVIENKTPTLIDNSSHSLQCEFRTKEKKKGKNGRPWIFTHIRSEVLPIKARKVDTLTPYTGKILYHSPNFVVYLAQET